MPVQPLPNCGTGGAGEAGADVEQNLLCDVLPDGDIAGTALAVYTYDETGAPVGPPVFVDPATGLPYVAQGVLQPCPGDVGCGAPVQFCFQSTAPVDQPGRMYDATFSLAQGFNVQSIVKDLVDTPVNITWEVTDPDATQFVTDLQTAIQSQFPGQTVTVTPSVVDPCTGLADFAVHIECLRLDQNPTTLLQLKYNSGRDVIINPAFLSTPPIVDNGAAQFLGRQDAPATGPAAGGPLVNCTDIANRGWETNDRYGSFEAWGPPGNAYNTLAGTTPTPRGTAVQEINSWGSGPPMGPFGDNPNTIWQTFTIPAGGNFKVKVVVGGRAGVENIGIKLSTGDVNDTGIGDIINTSVNAARVTTQDAGGNSNGGGGPAGPWTNFDQTVPLAAGTYTLAFTGPNQPDGNPGLGNAFGGLFTDMRVYQDAPGTLANFANDDDTCVVPTSSTSTVCEFWAPRCAGGDIVGWYNVADGEELTNAQFWAQVPAPTCCSGSSDEGSSSTGNLVHTYLVCGTLNGQSRTMSRVVVSDQSGGIIADTFVDTDGGPVTPDTWQPGDCSGDAPIVGEFILCDDAGPFIRKLIQNAQGLVTQVVNVTLGGAPYTPVGPVVVCSPSSPGTTDVVADCASAGIPERLGPDLIQNGDFANATGTGAQSKEGPGWFTDLAASDDVTLANAGTWALFSPFGGSVSTEPGADFPARTGKSLMVSPDGTATSAMVAWPSVPITSGVTYRATMNVAAVDSTQWAAALQVGPDQLSDVFPIPAPSGDGFFELVTFDFVVSSPTDLMQVRIAATGSQVIGIDNVQIREVIPAQPEVLTPVEYSDTVRAVVDQVVPTAGCNDERRDSLLTDIVTRLVELRPDGSECTATVLGDVCIASTDFPGVTLPAVAVQACDGTMTYLNPATGEPWENATGPVVCSPPNGMWEEVLCDEGNDGQPFRRVYNLTPLGSVVQYDEDLSGADYLPVGPVGKCPDGCSTASSIGTVCYTPPVGVQTVQDDWTGATSVVGGGSRVWTNSNFGGQGITVTETVTPDTGAALLGAGVRTTATSPASQHTVIDLGAPRSNVTVRLDFFGAAQGERLRNVTPAFTAVSGNGTGVLASTGVDGGPAADGTAFLLFAGPVQNISWDYAPTAGGLSSQTFISFNTGNATNSAPAAVLRDCATGETTFVDLATGTTLDPLAISIVDCPDAQGSTPIDQQDVEILVLCDATPTRFLRAIKYDAETGAVLSVANTTLDGSTPFVPVGAVGVCTTAIASDFDFIVQSLCDGNGTAFFRRLTFNSATGAVTSTTDTTLAGAAFVPVGTVGLCSNCCPQVIGSGCISTGSGFYTAIRATNGTISLVDSVTGAAVLAANIIPCPSDNTTRTLTAQGRVLTNATPWTPGGDVAGTLTSLTVTGLGGLWDLVDANGTALTGLPAGLTLTWSAEDDNQLTGPTSVTPQVGASVVANWTQR
ncbi:hypothetical protein [Streptomyces anulatus]|uniref:hypothetical protein n=1 Tax=Streptomyces anulatus TaxID=1892 RepID=UPI00341A0097